MNIKEITYKDLGEFLRDFATIIRKNNCGNVNEKTLLLTIGKYFGFEKEFCECSACSFSQQKTVNYKVSFKYVRNFK